jgi:glucosamine--fructose-6-phosphate aminotransferase (isomerizing)
MCGIVGAVAQRDVAPILLEGLRKLEYRGYDSAGVAILSNEQQLNHLRCLGKVQGLAEKIEQANPLGGIGIAHTRWATHGEPSTENAHPHTSKERIALVHNGIIENYEALRETLKADGYQFTSATDTEVIVHLVHQQILKNNNLFEAVKAAIAKLEGAYAIAVMDKQHPDQLVVAREGSPLVIGSGIGEMFIASDQMALLPVTRNFVYLEEGDMALIRRESYEIFDRQGNAVEREMFESELEADATDKGGYRHHMLKEIYQQPSVVADTLEGRIANGKLFEECFGPGAKEIFDQVKQVQIVACGTSYNAGMVARYWFEQLAGLPCQVEIASEIRYRKAFVADNTLFVSISQSGETADTLAALRNSKKQGYLSSLVVCNVPSSSLVRESELVLMTRAGSEIGVASTKAFTTQLVALMLLVIAIGRRHQLNEKTETEIVDNLLHLPRQIQKALDLNDKILTLAEEFADKHHALFLGRGTQYPIAMEGALKLKEISYIHAEAYPAGELKHGPLALVDSEMPIIAVAPKDNLLEKLKSNLEEVRARGGQLFLFVDEKTKINSSDDVRVVTLEHMHEMLAPVVYTIPLQLLSYHVAVIKGTDVDQPRNLAKSVTVE